MTENTAMGHGRWGIGLIPILNNFSAPGPTHNVISENTARANGAYDLLHTVASTPNKWVDNSYRTSSGADIK